MKKRIKYFIFGVLMLFGFSFNVNAESLPAVNASTKTITLDKNYVIDSITFDSASGVDVLDLNGKTLTLNGTMKVNKKFEIKNGTVIRSSSNTVGSLIEITSGLNGNVNLKNLVVDGNKIVMTSAASNGDGFGVFIKKDSTVVLDAVKIANNYTGTNIASGGLYIQAAKSVIIKNSKIYANKATDPTNVGAGAAIYAESGEHLEIKNTDIYDNFSAHSGNVYVSNVSNFILDKDSVISDNQAKAAAGIRLADTAGIIAGTIENNTSTADNGGGIYTIFYNNLYNDRVIKITETAKVINNTSACAGGGLYVNSDRANIPGKVIIDGATFSDNKALGTVDASDGLYKDIGGGAIAVARGILEINDVKMSNNTASIGIGNSIIVSNANVNSNGGKLTINGGSFDNTIDLGVGSIIVNGGKFIQDMSEYIVNSKIISRKTIDGYEVIENKVLSNDNVSFENADAMEIGHELVIVDKSSLLQDEKITENIESAIINKDTKAKVKDIKVLALYDISVSDGTQEIEMKDGKYKITINLNKEQLKYNSYAAVYVDDYGNVSYLPAKINGDKVTFETTHLSTYGIVGYNDITNPETNSNFEIIVSIMLFIFMFSIIGLSIKNKKRKA